MREILLVDDEPAITESLEYFLTQAGFSTRSAGTLAEASRALEQRSPALIILDLSLPDGHGFDWLRALRERASTPVLILSSHDDEVEHIVGLEIGADDYVNKPFSPREVVARIRAILRRSERGDEEGSREASKGDVGGGDPPPPKTSGRWSLDEARHQLCLDQRALELSPLEFSLLKTLLSAPEVVFSRSELIRHAWAPGVVVSERTVDVHIKSLRRKINAVDPRAGEALIETVRGVGYRLSLG